MILSLYKYDRFARLSLHFGVNETSSLGDYVNEVV